MNYAIKKALEDQCQAVSEMRKAMEDKVTFTSAKMNDLKAKFSKGEKANKEIMKRKAAQENTSENSKKVFDLLENKINKIPFVIAETEKKSIIKSFENYIKYPNTEDIFNATEQDLKYLRTDIAADGGVLVPEILDKQLLQEEIELSPILEHATVKVANTKSMKTVIRENIPSVNRVGEGGTSTVSNSSYKTFKLEAYRNDIVIPITREKLGWSNFNIMQEMIRWAALAGTQQTNIDFLYGDGINKSFGILEDSNITEIDSEIIGDLNMNDFLEIQKEDNIKDIYRKNGKFYMNTNTIFELATRKDGQGQYLWQQNIASGIPNQIAGKQYVDTPDMPDIGIGSVPVLFGDMKKGYYILRSLGVEVIIDVYSHKKQGIVEYMWVEFIGGKVALPEAFVKLRCGFIPTNIVNCELWLDGADTSTITLNGADVSNWADKSSNNYEVTQTTAVSQPEYVLSAINNKNILRFNGSSEYLEHIYESSLNPDAITIFVVCSVTGGTGTYRSPLTSRDTNQGYIYYASNANTWRLVTGDGGAFNSISDGTSSLSIPCILGATIIDGSQNFYVNGIVATPGTDSYSVNTDKPIRIGAGNTETTPGSYFPGDIAEIIIYSRVLTTEERIRIENYLSTKWGIEPLIPTDIADCELWLDGDDTDTITLNGSDVSEWTDKSGNNYDVIQSTAVSQPEYILSGMNNRNILRFDGSAEYLERVYEMFLNSSSTTIFTVCSVSDGAGTWRSPITSRDTNQGYMLYASNGNFWTVNSGTGSGWTSINGTAIVLSTPVVLSATITNGAQNFYVDGVGATPATDTYSVNTDKPIRIGAGKTEASSDFYFPGDIAEVIIYSRVLTDTERTKIEEYLAFKWGITL